MNTYIRLMMNTNMYKRDIQDNERRTREDTTRKLGWRANNASAWLCRDWRRPQP